MSEAAQLNEAGLLDDNEIERLSIDRLGDDHDHGFMAVEYDANEVESSHHQNVILGALTEKAIVRPRYNVIRNNQEE